MKDYTRDKIRHSRDSLFGRVNQRTAFLSFYEIPDNMWNIYSIVHYSLNEFIMRENKQNETINR